MEGEADRRVGEEREGRERDSIQAYRKLQSPVEYLDSHLTLGSLISSDGVTQLI